MSDNIVNPIPDDILHGTGAPTQARTETASAPSVKSKIKLSSLKDLINYGKAREEYKILGLNVCLKTLSSKEENDVFERMKDLSLTSPAFYTKHKVLKLAYAIDSVNGEELESAFESNRDMDKSLPTIEKNIRVISSMQAIMVDKLYSYLEKLEKEVNQKYFGAEVFEDIKN